MKYAVPIYKLYPCVSFQYHLTVDLQYYPSIIADNMLQLQSKPIIYLSSCRLNAEIHIPWPDSSESKSNVRSKIFQNAQLP